MNYLESPTQWISFLDEDDTTWLFDLTFLTSGWSCTFGTTCKGTEPQDNGARGCCAHGAHLIDIEDRTTVVDSARHLAATQWQNRSLVTCEDDLFDEVDGSTVTRTIDGACIFLNDRDFDGGHGCALHIGAVAAGERPLDWKPSVCWQVPFRLEEYEDGTGTRTVAVRAWRRSDWGDGGADFAWWCTDELAPGVPGARTWERHLDELRGLVGEAPVQWLVDALQAAERDESAAETAVHID